MNSRRVLPLGMIALLAACTIEEVAIPRTDPRLAVHAVLSATAPVQVMLLERTRSGSVNLVAPPFELETPFVNDEGIAEAGAVATLVTPGGQTLVGHEDLTPGGSGAGIYRFALPGELLVREGRYQLTVITTKGERLTATTSVPAGVAATFPDARTFDRSGDPIQLAWPIAAGARAYLVRIETPFGPRSFFTRDTSVRLAGDLRNADLTSLPHVFIPGFPQAITVSAVDSNFYDWFRTHNDELSGTGLINRIDGGLGVFGSLVRLRFDSLQVVAPQDDAVAGTFDFTGLPNEQVSPPYTSLELYVESRAARSDQSDVLSGRYARQLRLGDVGCPVCGLLGSRKGSHVQLVFLSDWFASDTADILEGEQRGDTIVGTYRLHAGVGRFIRKR
ncbi:MAG: hypothetical protein ACJ79K_04075 [Gemmatimonadaceae bacterium]